MSDRSTQPVQNPLMQSPSRRREAACTAAILALLSTLAWAPSAVAEVNRCERTDGSTVYTDRRCSDIGAVERLPRNRDRAAGRGSYHAMDCPRTVEDLRFQMTMAIDTHDVNQLASVYHWVGVSGRGAVPVMNRLQSVVQRPLVEIEMVRPQPAPPTLDPDGGIFRATSSDATSQPRTTPVVIREHKPVALRVVQTLAGTATPSDTVYRLHRYFGCIWITQ